MQEVWNTKIPAEAIQGALDSEATATTACYDLPTTGIVGARKLGLASPIARRRCFLGYRCGKSGIHGIYTSVSAHYTWIKQIITNIAE